MEIKDLQANSGKIELVVEVTNKEEARSFEKFGKSGKVCNAKIKDVSGESTLTLWNEDVEKVNVGDKIKVVNGWCSEYKGEKQVSAGKFGSIEVLEQGQPQVLTNDPSILGAQPEEEPVDVEEEMVE